MRTGKADQIITLSKQSDEDCSWCKHAKYIAPGVVVCDKDNSQHCEDETCKDYEN